MNQNFVSIVKIHGSCCIIRQSNKEAFDCTHVQQRKTPFFASNYHFEVFIYQLITWFSHPLHRLVPSLLLAVNRTDTHLFSPGCQVGNTHSEFSLYVSSVQSWFPFYFIAGSWFLRIRWGLCPLTRIQSVSTVMNFTRNLPKANSPPLTLIRKMSALCISELSWLCLWLRKQTVSENHCNHARTLRDGNKRANADGSNYSFPPQTVFSSVGGFIFSCLWGGFFPPALN